MAHLLRQMHLAATIESTPAKENFFPFRRTLIPLFSSYNASGELHTEAVGKNMALRTNDDDHESRTVKKKKNAPLAVLFPWLAAKESHVDKYRNLYLQRGFDVLTIQITPHQLMFPAVGTQVVATNLLEYLTEHSNYEKVLIHAFSVGAYMYGEVMIKIKENPKYSHIGERIAGVVLDSAVDVEGTATGVSRAISTNPVAMKFLEWYIQTHLKVLKNVATKHYIKASRQFHNTFLNCPALILVSENDSVGDAKNNSNVAKQWMDKGIDVTLKCWEKSAHVRHLHFHPEEYEAEIDRLLQKARIVNE